jgi:hypothetical protein
LCRAGAGAEIRAEAGAGEAEEQQHASSSESCLLDSNGGHGLMLGAPCRPVMDR